LIRYDESDLHEQEGVPNMVIITFPDRKTQEKALGFLLGRFSGKVQKSGEHIVPEAALEALAENNFELP
jgi:hypothetical protein